MWSSNKTLYGKEPTVTRINEFRWTCYLLLVDLFPQGLSWKWLFGATAVAIGGVALSVVIAARNWTKPVAWPCSESPNIWQCLPTLGQVRHGKVVGQLHLSSHSCFSAMFENYMWQIINIYLRMQDVRYFQSYKCVHLCTCVALPDTVFFCCHCFYPL